MRGSYIQYPNVRNALKNRLKAIKKAKWVSAMAYLINRYRDQGEKHFRWHDSGDLQSLDHLKKIIKIAELCKTTLFWLPTREYKLIKDYILGGGHIPENLNIRVSAPMIDAYQIKFLDYGVTVSGVHSDASKSKGFVCPAPTQNNTCADCRACWDKTVSIVSYHKH